MKESNSIKYVKSNFTILLENSEEIYYLFNTRTSAICKLDKAAFEFYENYPNNHIDDNFENLHSILISEGFLIESNQKEIDYIKHNLYKSRYDEKTLSLTIAPTMNCNFSCSYCFETNKEFGKMDSTVITQLKEFVSKKLHHQTKLEITWFGGEPLLALDTITELTESFISICKEKKCTYNSNLITNGYLVSQDILPILKNNLIRTIQITLDGSEEYHNQKRFLSDGSGTYKTLIHNIKLLKDNEFAVTVRLNQEKSNINSISEVLKDFESYEIDNVPVSFGRIEAYGNSEYHDKCLDVPEFAEIELNYHQTRLKQNKTKKVKLPTRLRNYCLADQVYAYVFDSKGFIYKCWNDIGNIDHSIGNLNTNLINNQDLFLSYMKFDPTIDKECKNCNVMPLCMGGCPHNRIYTNRTCSNLRYNISELVKLVVV
ncbi:radical SAM/SPASM domain-containing protein [Fusibacter sp. 3D3]|uniref:radical SAM/SPASM domain-containing protein n=1 Tax=Fusibacter sp. 3D3 TaxID=1048380 RepID=UPI0008538A4C|nr:SPASM domain-containing protein [Fusibacter sp. 3D3]GAU80078.1 arylarge subunitlfatase regulator [Fusibacter sp. 3D3]